MKSAVLGTAQWGLDYGTTNASGRLEDPVIRELAAEAWLHGITKLDTAPSYGDAESRISGVLDSFEVQTKVLAANHDEAGLRSSIQVSKKRMHRSQISAVLVHDWSALPSDRQREVAQVIEAIRDEGLCRLVGVSTYDEMDIVRALRAFTRLDIVQAPVSILDQRLVGSDPVRQLRDAGGLLQARSVLVQGAAMAPPDHAKFGRHPDVSRLRATGQPLELCMSFIAGLPWVDEVVLGVTSVNELNELVRNLESPLCRDDWSDFASRDSWLIDPRRWTSPPQGE